MSTDRADHVSVPDPDGDQAVHELLASPVSRRWLLKLCGSAAAALVATEVVPRSLAGLGAAPAAEAARGRARVTLHFALGPLPGITALTLHGLPGHRHAL